MTHSTSELKEVGREVEVLRVPIHQIRPNPNQPRKHFDLDALHSLRVSIRADGQIMPILLKPVNDRHAQQNGIKYELVDGERRCDKLLLWRIAASHTSTLWSTNMTTKDNILSHVQRTLTAKYILRMRSC